MTPMKKGKKQTKVKAWKPDRAIPKTTFDEYGEDVVTGLSSPYGPTLLGYWQWIDDDTISWSLTKNSLKKATEIGAETSGYLELNRREDLGVDFLDMHRSPNSIIPSPDYPGYPVSLRVIDDFFFGLTRQQAPNKLIYQEAGPVANLFGVFTLLDDINTQVARAYI
jgi:hypothetical protein